MRALPRALWACAVIAVVHAVLWAVLTPPFQTPDELGQSGYVQYLAETGKLPSSAKVGTSGEIGFTGTLLPHGIESRPRGRARRPSACSRGWETARCRARTRARRAAS